MGKKKKIKKDTSKKQSKERKAQELDKIYFEYTSNKIVFDKKPLNQSGNTESIYGIIKPEKVVVYKGEQSEPVARDLITRDLIMSILSGCKKYFGKGNYKFYNGLKNTNGELQEIQTISDFDVD